jgi:hypothetical protein
MRDSLFTLRAAACIGGDRAGGDRVCMRAACVGAVEMRESGTPAITSASRGSGVRARGGVYANDSSDFWVRGLGSGRGGC